MNSKVFRNLSYGVYIISTYDDAAARHTGCVANSVMQVTSSPATVAVSINHDNHTNACIKQHGYLSIAILGQDTDPALIGRFGFQSGRDTAKYEGLDHTVTGCGAIPTGCCGWMTCRVLQTMETSSHTVFLAEVMDGEPAQGTPMTYSYYHQVIKGKSPKNAPTYLPEEEKAAPAQEQYQCSVCKYIYEGETPFADLPEDYVCPICSAPKSKFVKL